MSKNKRLDGYKLEDGKICIELSLEKPEQIFDLRDPSAFINRDIDSDFEDFVVSATEDFGPKQPMKLQIFFSKRTDGRRKKKITDEEICQAIRNYFTYVSSITTKKLRRSVRNAQFFLAVGVVLLMVCLFGAEALGSFSSHPVLNVIKQGLEIIAWVSLWRPFETLIFDFWPIVERRRTFDKISTLEIKITDTQTGQTTTNLPGDKTGQAPSAATEGSSA